MRGGREESVKLKGLCMKCHEERFVRGWSREDNARWGVRSVWCAVLWDFTSTEEEAPETCPYVLEHALGRQENPT